MENAPSDDSRYLPFPSLITRGRAQKSLKMHNQVEVFGRLRGHMPGTSTTGVEAHVAESGQYSMSMHIWFSLHILNRKVKEAFLTDPCTRIAKRSNGLPGILRVVHALRCGQMQRRVMARLLQKCTNFRCVRRASNGVRFSCPGAPVNPSVALELRQRTCYYAVRGFVEVFLNTPKTVIDCPQKACVVSCSACNEHIQ
jgi:hypothetical protein